MTTTVDASVDKPIDRQLLERIKQMGKISMMFWRVRSTGVKKAEKSTRRLNNEYEVPEKARKGEALSLKSQYDYDSSC
jgi:hypothetical protein